MMQSATYSFGRQPDRHGFNQYGVQIMTPAYEDDPARPKLVPREQWYAAPAAPGEP